MQNVNFFQSIYSVCSETIICGSDLQNKILKKQKKTGKNKQRVKKNRKNSTKNLKMKQSSVAMYIWFCFLRII